MNDSKVDNETRVKLMLAYIQDIGRIGTRHENTGKFYVSLLSAFAAFLALCGQGKPLASIRGWTLSLVGAAGILVCVSWILRMIAFNRLFRAKFDSLRKLEGDLGVSLFTDEGRLLGLPVGSEPWTKALSVASEPSTKAPPQHPEQEAKPKERRYLRLTRIDIIVPFAFSLLFIGLIYAARHS